MGFFTEADANEERQLPAGFSDPSIVGGDDTIFISSGAGERWQVSAGGGTDTLKVDYSKVKTNIGLRHGGVTSDGRLTQTGYSPDGGGGLLYLAPTSPSEEGRTEPYIDYGLVERLDITGTDKDDAFPDTPKGDVFKCSGSES